MNLSKVVRAADQPDLTRWQAPDVGHVARETHTDAELDAIEQQARAKGYEVGRWEGLEAGHQTVQDGAQRLAQLYEEAAHPFRQITEDVERELVKLAGAIAREIVKQELKIEPELILEAVNQACSVLSASAKNIDVYLNSEDLALVKAALKDEPPAQHWRVVENRRMTRGDCQINSSEEFIDATLQTRIDGLVAGILSPDITVEE
ncbi:MAG: flagellar assembly protein FliH [Gammaproteobacteria bacterium]|nr:flagellar assembly protein FliH [Gammaproteobacteria bacterium]MBQ0839527.1 flagellar assembly protein FliH [Gammaproteobacteria bacterium]